MKPVQHRHQVSSVPLCYCRYPGLIIIAIHVAVMTIFYTLPRLTVGVSSLLIDWLLNYRPAIRLFLHTHFKSVHTSIHSDLFNMSCWSTVFVLFVLFTLTPRLWHFICLILSYLILSYLILIYLIVYLILYLISSHFISSYLTCYSNSTTWTLRKHFL